MKKVYLIGMGPDGNGWLTREADAALRECGLLIGAKRLLEAQAAHPAQKAEAVDAEKIIKLIEGWQEETSVAVLLSGDSGFYSGAKRLIELLSACTVKVLPGISAHQLLCARIGMSWEDAALVSVHGREQDVCASILNNQKTIVLTGSNMPPETVCRALCEGGLGFVRVFIGVRLGYPEEKIHEGIAESLAGEVFDPLSVLLIVNDRPLKAPSVSSGLPEDAFLRCGAPMTKQEIRAVSIAKLRLQINDVVWDIGAGTGSVAVECALLCRRGKVFAIERDPKACNGIRENREHFGVWHLRVVAGIAPDALAGLPKPDAVFIGGSGGNMRDILTHIKAMNEVVRVVINAVTLETLAEAQKMLLALGFSNVEITQIAASRARPVGTYHMMTAMNPVFILSGGGA